MRSALNSKGFTLTSVHATNGCVTTYVCIPHHVHARGEASCMHAPSCAQYATEQGGKGREGKRDREREKMHGGGEEGPAAACCTRCMHRSLSVTARAIKPLSPFSSLGERAEAMADRGGSRARAKQRARFALQTALAQRAAETSLPSRENWARTLISRVSSVPTTSSLRHAHQSRAR